MRLIDADLLIDELEKRVRTPRSTMEIVRDIIPMVKEQPTAYDVDKVVEELESKKDYYYNEMKKVENDTNYFSGHYFDESYNKRIALNEAIEIVKRGGIK
jgi:hypothetical protein